MGRVSNLLHLDHCTKPLTLTPPLSPFSSHQVAGLRQRLSEARSEADRMRTMAQSVAAERDAATAHILALQRELEARAAAIAALKSQAEQGHREVRFHIE